VKYLCPDCSIDCKPGEPLKGVLLTKFDYDFIGKKFTKDNPDLNLFSAVEEKYFPEFKCGNTPFFGGCPEALRYSRRRRTSLNRFRSGHNRKEWIP